MTEQFINIAKTTFEFYKTEQVIHIASDGQVFLQSNYNDAVQHQNYLNRGKDAEHHDELTAITRKQLAKLDAVASQDIVPTEESNNKDIVAWLATKGVEAKVNTKKADLLEKVTEILEAEKAAALGGGNDEEEEEEEEEEGTDQDGLNNEDQNNPQ